MLRINKYFVMGIMRIPVMNFNARFKENICHDYSTVHHPAIIMPLTHTNKESSALESRTE
ncbi:hypothetical protein T02_5583 [Trichinella nativa]|uniref:Uncharacterized protein n=1 Tax=Trichinella nativa TaxID=6335 RepID=A0A0V1LCQ6_9BILA|nr:hypothetical protein T06_5311 [Trichinella sp. T6]KRZ57269.1 hypothetical protein T02_5583 [Trichinella nativa]